MRIAPYLAAAALALAACDNDSYNTGDGRYSYMSTDFVEAHTAAKATVDRIVTDEGVALQLSPAITAAWADKADTTYRALLYYDYHEGATTVRPRSISQVPVLSPIQTARPDTLHTDPLTLVSTWKSTSGKYLNLRLSVKTGTSDDGTLGRQTIGVRCDTLTDNGRDHLVFTLLHNQNGVPQYYSATAFASIPLDNRARAAKITLRIATYGGIIERQY